VLPFGAGSTGFGFWPASEAQPRANDLREAVSYLVGPEYLDVMGIPLLRGRNFTRQDDARAPRVGLIDKEFARSVFPGRNAIGERIRLGFQDEPLEVVGIVGHVKHYGLDDDDRARVRAQLYLPYTQLPDAVASLVPRNLTVVLRSDSSLATLLPALRREIAAFDSTQTISNERLLIDAIAGSIATRRFSMFVLGVFAGVGLLLSCIGIYGVVSYLTAQRTAEIGVRMAVGASPWGVLLLIVKDGYRLAILGIALGLLAAVSLTRLISSQLYEVAPTDPMTLGAVSLVVIVTTLAACYIPARRAASLSPVEALRVD
jgi:predicted permease